MEDGPWEEVYRTKIEDSLYESYIRNVHVLWGAMDTEKNCEILWKWYRSRLTFPRPPHPLTSIVYTQLSFAALYRNEDNWVQHYSRLSREEIDPEQITFEAFIALSLLVEKTTKSQTLIL